MCGSKIHSVEATAKDSSLGRITLYLQTPKPVWISFQICPHRKLMLMIGHQLFFTARRYAKRDICHRRVSVRPSVRPSANNATR